MSEKVNEHTALSEEEDAEFSNKPTLVSKIKGWRSGLGERWAKLHTNQVIYLIALILFLVVNGRSTEPSTLLWFIGILGFFGMARELWAIFIKVWESTFGRLVLLVVYAAIANFTLAVASQKVNIVISADPTQLYHTLGVTTLLILPLWLMVVSVIAMIVIFSFMQILRGIRYLLVATRIISRKTTPKEAFPKTFVLVRLILLVPVSMALVTSLNWYSDQLNLPKTPWLSLSGYSSGVVEENVTKFGLGMIEIELQKENLSEQDRNELLQVKSKLLEDKADTLNETVIVSIPSLKGGAVASVQEDSANTLQTIPPTSPAKVYFLDGIIASFVYHYEAFQYSHCQKSLSERVVYISENDILVVQKDKSAVNGYVFSTRTCIVSN